MKKFYVLFILLTLLISSSSFAQLTGTKTIPGDYASIAAAVTDLNTVGVGAGGVTFNVAAGYTENTTDVILLTATGTQANPIVFQKSGSGNNPKVTRTDAGSLATSTLGGQGDAVIIIQGSDYVTFDRIDVANVLTGIEYGYYLRKASVTDGCKFVTVKNAVISMVKGSNYVCGIYSSNNDASSLVSSATGITVTSVDGRNENVTFTGNTITGTFTPILLRGFNHATAPYDFYDQNFIVGAQGAGNILQNFGGSATAYGVYLIYHNNANVSYNSFDNMASGGAAATSTFYGIFHSTGTASSFTANNNTINLTINSSTSSIYGINNAATGNLTINNNSITITHQVTSSGTVGYIYNSSATASTLVTIAGNTFNGSTLLSTASTYLIYNNSGQVTPGITNVYNNTTSGTINRTAASGAFYCYYNNASPTGTENIYDNTFTGITLAGSSTFDGILTTTNASHTHNIYNNTISNITGGIGQMRGIHRTIATANVYNNTVSGFTGGGTILGISCGSGLANIYKNVVRDLTSTSSGTTPGTVTGIVVSGSTTGTYIYNNYISELKAPSCASTDAIRGISSTFTTTLTTLGLYYNTIFLNASSTGANFGTSGIYHTYASAATSAALDLRNNIIVNTSTAAGTGKTAALRRSVSTDLVNYATTSNNNLFYAGTPSETNVIYFDNTNFDQTLEAFKARVTPREDASVSENPPFINSATPPYNLHISTTTPTLIESGGAPVTAPIAITTDFDGDNRHGTVPDIGADEFNGTRPVLPPAFSVTPTSKDFGNQQIATSSADFLFTVKNTGGGSLPISSVVLGGVNAASFVKTDTNTYPKVLGGGQSLVFAVKFAPADTGIKNASITITYTLPGEETAVVPLTGYGFDARIQSFPYTNSFEDSPFPLGWQTAPITGTYAFERVTSGTNPTASPYSGSAMLRYASYSASAGQGALLISPQITLPSNDYRLRVWMYRDSLYATNNDRMVFYLNSSASLTGADSIGGISRSKSLEPVVTGINGWYEYTFNFPANSQGTKYLIVKSVSAFGANMYLDHFTIEQAPAQPVFAIDPVSKDFGPQQVGVQSAITNFTVSNTGGGSLVVYAPALTGANAASFVRVDTNTYPKSLGQGQSLVFGVRFAPADTGAKAAAISIEHSATGSPAIVNLTGVGVDYSISNFPYYQNFDSSGGAFPPAGWSNPGNYWLRGSGARSAPYCARVTYNYSAVNQAFLITPPINLPPNAKITFWWKDNDIAAKSQEGGEHLAMSSGSNPSPEIVGQDTTFFEISTDGGTNWTTLAFLSAAAPQSAFVEQIVDLSNFAGNARLLRWRDKTNASFSAYGTGLDDIVIEVVPQITLDWYNLQWPLTATISEGSSVTVYAQAYKNGVTPNPADTTIKCWIGYSTTNTNPNTWTNWVPATFNVVVGNNNEYKANIGANLPAGTYYYASRFQLLNGPYTYGGASASNGGPWNGTTNISGVLTINPVVISQFPMSESFEGTTFPPVGWKIVDLNGGPTWNQSNIKPRTGLLSARYNYSTSLPGNDWLITPALELQAGKTYRIAYGYAARSASYAENLKVALGRANVPDSLTTVLADHPNIISTDYLLGNSMFTVPASGNYYIGFHCYSLADKYDLFLDDIFIAEVPPVDVAVLSINQLNAIPVTEGDASALVKGEEITSVDPSTLVNGKESGLLNSNPAQGNNIIGGSSLITGEGLDGIVPVQMRTLIGNTGLNATSYLLNYTIDGVAGAPVNRPSLPAGSVDTVLFGSTPANRGTVTTTVTVSATGDTVNAANNTLAFYRTLVYPDSAYHVRYDNGINTPNTFIGFGANNIAVWAAVRMNAPANMKLANIDAFYRNEASNDSIMVGIWGAGADSLAPGPLLYTKKFGGNNYIVPGTGGDYITLPLGSDAPGFQQGQTFWVSLTFKSDVQYPLGAHNSPLTNPGRSFISQDSGKTWFPLVITTERAWLVRAVGVNWTVPALQLVWEKSQAKGNLPAWFSPSGSTERGFGYGVVNGNERVYVVSRNGGTFVRVINANTGNDVGTLDVTGITGGTFVLNDIGVTVDGKILAANLATTLNDTFRVYMWNSEAAAPVKVVDYVQTTLARLGDKITITGDFSNNTAVIWAASATAAVPKVFRWTMTGGAFNAVPEEITLSDATTGSTASVGPIPGNGFYHKANGLSVKHYSMTGQLMGTVPGTVVATGANAIRWTSQMGGTDYFAVFQYGTGNQNARVVGVPANDYANAFTFGLTPPLGVNANSNGTGDIEVRKNTNGTADIFVMATNNGFGVYRSTQPIPVDLSAFGAFVTGNDVTLNWTTVTEINNSGFSIERKEINGEYKSIAFVEGSGNTTELTRYSYIDKGVSAGSYIYRLKQMDYDGTFSYSSEVKVDVSVPNDFSLAQNYPNPFNPSTMIKYAVPVDGMVTISIYNVLGQKVATLVNEVVKAGTYEVSFDASKFSTGVYIYKMESGNFSSTKKMMLVK